MSPRIKKLIGLAILLPGASAYFLFAAAFADVVPAHWLAKLVYFIVAGVIWAFPCKYLILWMNREPPQR